MQGASAFNVAFKLTVQDVPLPPTEPAFNDDTPPLEPAQLHALNEELTALHRSLLAYTVQMVSVILTFPFAISLIAMHTYAPLGLLLALGTVAGFIVYAQRLTQVLNRIAEIEIKLKSDQEAKTQKGTRPIDWRPG